MLLIFVLVCVGLLVWHVLYTIQSGSGSLNWFIVAPLVTALAVGGWFELQWWNGQKEGSELVQLASGVENASLRCQRVEETVIDVMPFKKGSVSSQEPHTVNMKFDECSILMDWLRSSKLNPTGEQSYALHVLTHEAMHVAGYTDEAETECASLAKFEEVATAAGASGENAAKMQEQYLSEYWPKLPNNYKKAC